MEIWHRPTDSLATVYATFLQENIPDYGFRPKEEEMINYLKSDKLGVSRSFCVIPMLQDICSMDPWNLPKTFNEISIIPSDGQECWFICPQTQSKRISRKTPCGYSWKKTGKPKEVKAEIGGKKIGVMKVLVFPSEGQTTWVIHEYHLLDSDDYVLCRVMRRPLADLAWHLEHTEGSFDEDLIQAKIDSLVWPVIPQECQILNSHRQTHTIVSLCSVPSLVAHEKPVAPPVRAASVKYDGKEEVRRFKKVKQETAAKEHGSAGNSPRKTNSKEIEHAREKSNSVTALTRPTTMSTKCSASSRLISLRNMVVAIFLLYTVAKYLI